MVHEGLRHLRGLKVLKEIRDHLDLRAIRALKDPRKILVNPSQLLYCVTSGIYGGKRNLYSLISVRC